VDEDECTPGLLCVMTTVTTIGGKVSTIYHGLEVWDGVQGPIMLHVFLSFSAALFADLQSNSLRPSPSHPATDSQFFRFHVKTFSRSALATGHQKFSSLGPKPALGGPA